MSTAPPGGRARILQVARDAFVERGYAEVSMQELASAAGLTKAAIYYHFKDKQELFEAVVMAEVERIYGAVAAQLDAGPPLRAQLERVANFALGVDRGDRSRLIADAHRYCGEERLCVLKEQIETPFGLLRSAFVAAQAAGEIRDGDVDLVVTFFLNLLEGQIKGAGFGPALQAPPEHLARAMVDLLMDGIATAPRPSAQAGTLPAA